MALPAILYGTSVIPIPNCKIKVENGVGRKILGAPKYATVTTIRGEIGMSEMRSRITGARLRYVKGIEEGKNELLKKILGQIREEESNRWKKETKRYVRDIGVSERKFWRMGRNDQVKDKVREWTMKDGRKRYGESLA